MPKYRQLEDPGGLLAIYPEEPTSPRVQVLSSHELFVNQGLIDKDPVYEALVNLNLGSHIASLQTKKQIPNADVVIIGCLEQEVRGQVLAEIDQILNFNKGFYNQVRAVGTNIGYREVPSISSLRSNLILPDRNSQSLAENILNRPELGKLTMDLNDKAYYGNLFANNQLEIASPRSGIIDIPDDLIDNYKASNSLNTSLSFYDYFVALIKQGKLIVNGLQFDPDINYFVKVSNSKSGKGITRLTPENAKELFESISILFEIRQRGGNPKLILAEPIDVDPDGNPANPTDSAYSEYFSPCLTLRITSDNTSLGQVADQVLAGGTRYLGSYFNQALQTDFLNRIAPTPALLAKVLQEIGYEGYFGTDFIRQQQGPRVSKQYAAVIDPNARMNGNDLSFIVRRAAVAGGVDVFDTFQSKLSYSGQYENLAALLDSGLKRYQYDHQTNSGIVLASSVPNVGYLAQPEEQQLMSIYLNPTRDKDRFDEFYAQI